MDFITNLLTSNGFDSIFIVVDQGLSKGVILMPCNKTVTAEETAKLYIDNVFIQYGLRLWTIKAHLFSNLISVAPESIRVSSLL